MPIYEVSVDEIDPVLESAETKYDIEFGPYKITKEMMKKAVLDLESTTKHTDDNTKGLPKRSPFCVP